MNSTRKSQNVFAHSSSLQILWKCAGQRRLVTKTLINSVGFKTIYTDVLHYVNSKSRRRSPLSLILDSHLMLGLVYVYSKTVLLWHHDVENLYKDAIVQRFFEFDDPKKSKLTRKKDATRNKTDWQIEIDENLLPDERILLERDFSIEIPRQTTPPLIVQSPENFPPLPWEVSKPTHGKRITLLPDIEEPTPKFDLIDDRFGEPFPPPITTSMEIEQREKEDRTFFRTASKDRNEELLRAPRVDRHLGATDRYIHPRQERTIDEHQTKHSFRSDFPPLPMETTSIQLEQTNLSTFEQFSIDAMSFINSSIDSYPIHRSISISDSKILLSVDCISSTDVPMIVIEEATVIGHEQIPMQIDALPRFDQELPSDRQETTFPVDAQVPDVMIKSNEEKEIYHLSKKSRNAPNAIDKRRKYSSLYQEIVQFDYELLEMIAEEQNSELEKLIKERKPWSSIVGREGTKRMKDLIEKSINAVRTADPQKIMNDITNLAKILTNPEESEDLAVARRTGEEIAIRRGQSSGLLPKTGTRSPSSIVPMIQDRQSEIPLPPPDGEILPTFPSGFDEIPLIVTAPSTDIRVLSSPLETSRRRRFIDAKSIEPSPTLHDKQKQKAIEDILNLTENFSESSFNEFLHQQKSSRFQAARFFSVLLVLCAEGRIQVHQNRPFDEIQISRNRNR